jgi:hypothetical protein
MQKSHCEGLPILPDNCRPASSLWSSLAVASGSFTPLQDALGSTIALVDGSGNIATSYTYDPFGNTTVSGAVVDVNQRGNFGDSLLHVAAGRQAMEDMEILVACGARVNAQGDLGNTPLHQSASRGLVKSVRKLLQLGADKTIKNEDGQIALDLAELMGRDEVAKSSIRPNNLLGTPLGEEVYAFTVQVFTLGGPAAQGETVDDLRVGLEEIDHQAGGEQFKGADDLRGARHGRALVSKELAEFSHDFRLLQVVAHEAAQLVHERDQDSVIGLARHRKQLLTVPGSGTDWGMGCREGLCCGWITRKLEDH